MANWYVGSTKYTAVTQWAASTAYSVGDLRRQLAAPTAGNERVFRCTTAGTSGGTEPTWTLTKGGTTNDNGVVWTEVTGDTAYGWTAAHYKLANALSWAANGDTIYVSNNHAYSGVSGSVNFKGTPAAPMRVICVDDSASPPTTLAATASETYTDTSAQIANSTSANGSAYVYGINFSASSSSSYLYTCYYSQTLYFDKCSFTITKSPSTLLLGASSSIYPGRAVYKDCAFTFNNTSQVVDLCGRARLEGCVFNGSNIGSVVLYPYNFAFVVLKECDLSLMTTALCSAAASNTCVSVALENCKLGNAVAMTTGSWDSYAAWDLVVRNCDSSGTNYRLYKGNYFGTLVQETTTVRTGGASDGTTSVSFKIVTSSGSNIQFPFISEEFAQWHDSSGSSVTVSVEIAGSAALKNDEIWLEVGYPASASSPLGAVASSRVADLMTAGSTYTSSGATWGGSPSSKQVMSVTFTPYMKGVFKARVCVAKASTTVYVDPLMTVA